MNIFFQDKKNPGHVLGKGGHMVALTIVALLRDNVYSSDHSSFAKEGIVPLFTLKQKCKLNQLSPSPTFIL